jgi:hypothetical protein
MSKSIVNNAQMNVTMPELNSSNSNLPNSRSSSYQRKFVENLANNGNIKIARTSVNGAQKTPTTAT